MKHIASSLCKAIMAGIAPRGVALLALFGIALICFGVGRKWGGDWACIAGGILLYFDLAILSRPRG